MSDELNINCYECEADYIIIVNSTGSHDDPEKCTFCGSSDIEVIDMEDDADSFYEEDDSE